MTKPSKTTPARQFFSRPSSFGESPRGKTSFGSKRGKSALEIIEFLEHHSKPGPDRISAAPMEFWRSKYGEWLAAKKGRKRVSLTQAIQSVLWAAFKDARFSSMLSTYSNRRDRLDLPMGVSGVSFLIRRGKSLEPETKEGLIRKEAYYNPGISTGELARKLRTSPTYVRRIKKTFLDELTLVFNSGKTPENERGRIEKILGEGTRASIGRPPQKGADSLREKIWKALMENPAARQKEIAGIAGATISGVKQYKIELINDLLKRINAEGLTGKLAKDSAVRALLGWRKL